MINRICSSLFLVGLVFTLTFLIGFSTASYAWLRDANIAASSDSVGVGWWVGLSLTAEKKLSNSESVGVYFFPKSGNFDLNIYQISYNRQFVGKISDPFSAAYYLGILSFNNDAMGVRDIKTNIYPDLGMVLSWRILDESTFRMKFLYIVPCLFEYAHKLDDNLELGVSLGYPFQLLGLRWMF